MLDAVVTAASRYIRALEMRTSRQRAMPLMPSVARRVYKMLRDSNATAAVRHDATRSAMYAVPPPR